MPPPPANLHGTALVIGEAGLLALGESGAGKSSLALALIETARAQGRFGALVSDDRVLVAPRGGRLLARAHPVIAGRIEARGAGILALPHLPCAVIDAVIMLENAPQRLPEKEDCQIAGICLPRLRLRHDADLRARCALVFIWLRHNLGQLGL